MEEYDLYRFTHPDGSSKDWAIRRNPDGTITTRWGRTGPTLPQVGTRHQDKIALENAKRRKGYVHVGKVLIDDRGKIQSFKNDAQEESAPSQPAARKEVLYWRIRIGASATREQLLEWGKAVTGAANRLGTAFGLDRSERADFEPGVIAHWRIPGTGASGAGQIGLDQRVVPLLVLMTMKRLAPDDASVSLATEDGIEIGTDLRKELQVLEGFGTDLESVRPMAEALGLLPPRITLAEAIQTSQDCWF
jgi:predicted DNA-binding WGR domain protein